MTVWGSKLDELHTFLKEREHVESLDIARKVALGEAANLLIEVWPEIEDSTVNINKTRSNVKTLKEYIDKLMWQTTRSISIPYSTDESDVDVMIRRNRYLLEIREAFDFTFRLCDRGHMKLFLDFIKMNNYLRP